MTPMRRLRPLAALALIAVAGAGCSDGPAGNDGAGTAGATSKAASKREKAMEFAACMRDHGVAEFPDPDAAGELTADAVANDSPVDTSAPAFEQALGACKDLQPSGFTGHERSAEQQQSALAFARCMRENGVEDFPDPTRDGPLVDTRRIPSAEGRGALSMPELQAAMETCGRTFGDELGLKRP
jgi:hypothetical protein